ncbi:hypothetical protein [Adlercreutzia muris]|uniref:hypothetical protein n=1 Tax=Adlercreutzia muris TaxID=1796610 RepID=UPI00136668F4|nr:hypothetical protein [Adlercreutzia muris]NCA32153.1 hypothetical protein [Adlercreutzia muris]
MSSLTADERLALLNAMAKAVKPRLDEAKAEAQDGLMDRFAEDGTDRRAIMVGGEKVGEVGMSFTKAAPAVKPGHEREALEAAIEMGLVDWSKVPSVLVKDWQKRFSRVGDAVVEARSAELIDWLEWTPSRAKGASVRGCAPDVVLPALTAKLGTGGIAALLGGGDGE